MRVIFMMNQKKVDPQELSVISVATLKSIKDLILDQKFDVKFQLFGGREYYHKDEEIENKQDHPIKQKKKSLLPKTASKILFHVDKALAGNEPDYVALTEIYAILKNPNKTNYLVYEKIKDAISSITILMLELIQSILEDA